LEQSECIAMLVDNELQINGQAKEGKRAGRWWGGESRLRLAKVVKRNKNLATGCHAEIEAP
jgi:hypothetical protein